MTIDIKLMRRKARRATALLKALANEQRLMIFCHLMEGEKSVNELVKLTGLSQSALSQHLARLRRDSLVTARREQQKVFYSLSSADVPVILYALQGISGR